jgi:hypothetical protein
MLRSVFSPSLSAAAIMPSSAKCARSLLINRFDGNEAHAGPRHRLADGGGIGGVVFASLHIGLHVTRRHQTHGMPERRQLARPMVRGRTSLHTDEAWLTGTLPSGLSLSSIR